MLRETSKIYLSFVVVVFVVFFNSVANPFVHDDLLFIENNSNLINFKSVVEVFYQSLRLKNVNLSNPYYRPLLEVVYYLQYKLLGLNPFGYHLFNMLLHLGNGFLIFHLLKKLLKKETLAWFISILFLIHPLQTEPVSCIAGISNLLFAFLGLLVLHLYRKSYDEDSDEIQWHYLGGAAFCFILALFAKEQVIVLPLVLIGYDLCFFKFKKGPGIPRKLLCWGLFIGISVLYLMWRKTVLGNSVVPIWVIQRELGLRLLTIPRIIFLYLRLFFLPYDLHYYRNMDLLQTTSFPFIVFVGFLAGLYGIIQAMPRGKRAVLYFSWGWFFVFLLPVINIIPIITEYSYVAVFEHFMYLPVLGLLVFFVVILDHVCSHFDEIPHFDKIKVVFWGGIIIVASLVSIKQNTYWRSEIALFERTVKYEKNFGRAHILLGLAYCSEGLKEAGVKELEQALPLFYRYYALVDTPRSKNYYLDYIHQIQIGIKECH